MQMKSEQCWRVLYCRRYEVLELLVPWGFERRVVVVSGRYVRRALQLMDGVCDGRVRDAAEGCKLSASHDTLVVACYCGGGAMWR